jgi:hypothetical protein
MALPAFHMTGDDFLKNNTNLNILCMKLAVKVTVWEPGIDKCA